MVNGGNVSASEAKGTRSFGLVAVISPVVNDGGWASMQQYSMGKIPSHMKVAEKAICVTIP